MASSNTWDVLSYLQMDVPWVAQILSPKLNHSFSPKHHAYFCYLSKRDHHPIHWTSPKPRQHLICIPLGRCSWDRNLKNILRQLREILEHGANLHGKTPILFIPGVVREYNLPTSHSQSQRGPGGACRWISSNFLLSLGNNLQWARWIIYRSMKKTGAFV